MPPIPVYTKSPINPAKASGVTPETAAPADSKEQPSYVPAQTTSSPIQPYLNDSRSLTPTRTVPLHGQSPPPPQPGAVPRLPEATGAPSSSSSSSSPAAPTATGPPPPAITAAPVYPPPPPQLGIPPPQVAHNQRGTSTAPPPPPTGATSTYHSGQYGGGSSYPSPYQGVGGVGRGVGGQQEEEDEGILGSAVKLAKAAGQKLASAESEVWRRINGEGN